LLERTVLPPLASLPEARPCPPTTPPPPLFDLDTVEDVNLDRLLHATARDARLHRAKVDTAARVATASVFTVALYEHSVVEPEGFAAVTDCDVIFCVDRPWLRAALNLLANAHLIPVGGGIVVQA
jgi:molybdopterin-synthase adenylyltransferase